MTHFKKKQKSFNPHLKLWAGAVALLVVGVFLVVADIKMYARRQELNAEVKSLQSKIDATKQDNAKLEQGISEATNNQYLEKVAREEMDLQKPGEKVVSFIVPEEKPKQEPQPNVVQVWLGAALDLFKK